jgi:formamidopyrimidine-DNA glycosylase
VYIEALTAHVAGRRLDRIRLMSPFVLRTVDPPLDHLFGATVQGVSRVGKRIALAFGPSTSLGPGPLTDPGALILVIHLMIAGRLRWRGPGEKAGVGAKIILAALEFEHGTLLFTEAGSKKRASLQVVRGADALRAIDPGGIEPLDATLEAFRAALTRENHTLKRALTDPHIFSGIGNAYSDEILHDARLSPMKLTSSLDADEIARLYHATRSTLQHWILRLREDAAGEFPEKVTAFRDGMAVHGRYRQPCPVCGSPIQRIAYAHNEANYCATCQTGGKLLSDRALSRLLKDDWPRTLEEMERRRLGK